ncbi:hypothetical protein [Micromonospora sp. Llam0]|uniref:hypothetical protein n=1 Tax=Micromonospora sp. Llam0 TaxID=2485143 RepID=UPI0013157788|nr:hypothetical protein [Micromonospora sp. Llam0]
MTDDQAVTNPAASSASPTPYSLITPPLFAALTHCPHVPGADVGLAGRWRRSGEKS